MIYLIYLFLINCKMTNYFDKSYHIVEIEVIA